MKEVKKVAENLINIKNLTAEECIATGDGVLRDMVFGTRFGTIANLEDQGLEFRLFAGCFVYWQVKKDGAKNPSQNAQIVKDCAKFFETDVETVKNYLLFAEKIKVTSEEGEK